MRHPDSPHRRLLNWGRLVQKHRGMNPRPLQGGGDLYGDPVSYEKSEQLWRECGDKEGLAYSLVNQALILHERGDLDRADAFLQTAQRIYREAGNREGMIQSLDERARIVGDRADFDGAMALYEDAECLYRELGNRDEVALSLRNEAKILRARRDMDQALELLALILFACRAEARQLQFTPFQASGIYGLGERAGWTVSPARRAGPAASYVYEIRKNNSETIQSGTLDFASGSATIEAALEEPAMLYVTVKAEGAPPASAFHLGAAIAPTLLQSSEPRPADFDSFWDAKVQELGAIPLHPVTTPVAARDGVELCKVQVHSWSSRLHGYLARPATPGKLPALVMFQYAGVYALRPSPSIHRALEGWLAFDVVAHDMPPDRAGGVCADYETIGNTGRETSYFLGMYLRAARALDYIASRPDWDGRTLVLMGTCMGGQQAFAAAALRPEVTALLVNQPSGADVNGDLHGRKAGYPYWPSQDAKVMAAARYFDIVNFAPRIKAPVLASMGFIDTTSPPAGIWTALNQLQGPKEVVAMIDLDHTSRTRDRRGVFRSRAAEVLDMLRRGEVYRPPDRFTRLPQS